MATTELRWPHSFVQSADAQVDGQIRIHDVDERGREVRPTNSKATDGRCLCLRLGLLILTGAIAERAPTKYSLQDDRSVVI